MKLHAALALALSAAAAPAVSQTPPPRPPVEAMTKAMPYVVAAAMSDLYEINSSRIALEKSQNPKVRLFASMLIKDHTSLTAATMKAAQRAGVTAPPSVMDAGTTASIAELQNASAADFDRLYLGQQIPAHRTAFELHSYYSNAGDQRVLRENAKKAISRIGRHLDMAIGLQKGLARS